MIYEDYYIFTPGPVKMSKEILEIGGKQTPYFRNKKFSEVVLQCEKDLLELVNAPKGSRVVFLTASGTAGMEATIMNLLDKNDNAIVINGGNFGQRFVDICNIHNISHKNFKVQNTNLSNIEELIFPENYNTLIVNAHETSIGLLYDLDTLGSFAKKNDLFFIVDAISMFVTDPIDMTKQNIDVIITSSQKGLALPPGLTMVILSPRALKKLKNINSLYFNFKDYLKNGERGQTPFTPPVTIILQLEARLEQIKRRGGVSACIEKTKKIANYFREKIKNLPLKPYTQFMPNAMTALTPTDGKRAIEIVKDLEEKYKIIVCPNGGKEKDKIFRVSHMGEMTFEYTDVLIDALHRYYDINS
jgi:aspartate aminotransferase-like enzyme